MGGVVYRNNWGSLKRNHWCTFGEISSNYGLKENVHSSYEFKSFSYKSKKSAPIALTIEELELLENLEFTKEDERLYRYKFFFLLQCYTGLRVSDVSKLTPENFDIVHKTITLNTQKTSEDLVIPIVQKLYSLLGKYPIGSFKFPCKQGYNTNIRKICNLAGINQKIKVNEFVAGSKQEKIVPKYELIGSHTARRTFITLSLKLGILPEVVMKVTGHKSRQAFQGYVRIAQSDVKDAFKAWD